MIYDFPNRQMKTYDITDVQITPVTPQGGLRAFASLVINGNLFLGSIAIHEKLDGSGLRLTYPTKRAGNSERNIFHPVTPELSKVIEQVLFAEYRRRFG